MKGVENAELKLRVDALEKENRELKRSVYELSSRLSQLQWLLQKAKSRPFEVERQPAPARAAQRGQSNAIGQAHNGAGQTMANPAMVASGELSPGARMGQEFSVLGIHPIAIGDGRSNVGTGDLNRPFSERDMPHQSSEPHLPAAEFMNNNQGASQALGRNLDSLLHQQDQRNVRQTSDLRSFQCSAEFSDHSGAVYCCKWSPCGSFIASGSLDKKVLVRPIREGIRSSQLLYQGDTDAYAPGGEEFNSTLVLSGHDQLITEIKWSTDSTRLVSASYDHTVKLWQIERAPSQHAEAVPGTPRPDVRGWLVQSFTLEGMVQTVEMDLDNGNLLWAGTNKGSVVCYDLRTGKMAGTLGSSQEDVLQTADGGVSVVPLSRSNAMINTLHIPQGSPFLLSGDSRGVVRTFDWRKNACIKELTFLNEAAGRPITHITSTYGSKHRRLLAINSYDNILRVYDRNSLSRSSPSPTFRSESQQSTSPRPDTAGSNSSDSDPALKTQTCAYTLTGHRNKNWPIKCSFFCDPENQDARYANPTSPRLAQVSPPTLPPPSESVEVGPSSLLATGSASTSVYVFGLFHNGESELIQKLRGHSGRVYACDFSHADSLPMLASCSADSCVKIWTLKHDEN